MATKTKLGTTIFGTYPDGAGSPNQSHMIFDVNNKRWWLFYVKSDVAGNPGTHVLGTYYSDRVNISDGTATWTAGTDSPNFDASSATGNTTAKFNGGRAVGCCFVNNPGGTNKSIMLCCVSVYTNSGANTNSWNGLIRAVFTSNTVTWGNWGGWTTPSWNSTDALVPAGNVIGITADGYAQFAGGNIHSELDCSVVTTIDPCIQDTWQEGNIVATSNVTSGSALVTNMSNQTRLRVGMSLSADIADWNTVRVPKINSIDSSTQVTMSNTATASGTNTPTRWWQGTLGANRTNTIVDTTMVHECGSYGFASLDDGNMVLVYDNGAQAPPNIGNLKSIKSNQTQANGFWPSTTDGTGSVNVFSGSVTIDYQDWCVSTVDRNNIFCFRRSGNTSIEANKYSVGGNTWSALATQPPTATGVIKAGGGVVAIDNGFDLWLFYIDGTNNNIVWNRYSVANGTWGTWATLCAVGSTASKLSCSAVLGPITGIQSQAGLVWSEQNGANYDAYVTGLQVGDPPDWDGIDNRIEPRQQMRRGSGVR